MFVENFCLIKVVILLDGFRKYVPGRIFAYNGFYNLMLVQLGTYNVSPSLPLQFVVGTPGHRPTRGSSRAIQGDAERKQVRWLTKITKIFNKCRSRG